MTLLQRPRIRSIGLLTAAAVTLIGCSSGSDSSDSSEPADTATIDSPEPESSEAAITLLTTTTTTPPPTTSTAPTTTSPPTTSTTPTATTEPPPTTTIDPAIEGLVLRTDGIGSASFGAEPDGVVEFVGSFLGAPDRDTGYVDPLSIGPCPGEQLRLVSWGALTLEFADVSRVAEGRPHFYAYTYGLDGEIGVEPIGLVTEEGITAGSPVVDLVAAYPDAVLNPEDEFIAANFFVSDDLRGLLTGLGDQDVVTVIAGGQGCGE